MISDATIELLCRLVKVQNGGFVDTSEGCILDLYTLVLPYLFMLSAGFVHKKDLGHLV